MNAGPQAPGWWPDWSLFGDALGTGLLLGGLLPWCGVLLVLRQQVFVAAAIGQAANCGVAAAIAAASWSGFGHLHAGSGAWWFVPAALASMAAGIAALRQRPHAAAAFEARSAWLFLAGSAGAVLLLADQPHGQQDLQRLFL